MYRILGILNLEIENLNIDSSKGGTNNRLLNKIIHNINSLYNG